MVKGQFRPTPEEHAAYLEEMRGWLSDDDPMPDIDEQEACRVMAAIDDGEIQPEDVVAVASNSRVLRHIAETAQNRMLLRDHFAELMKGR